MTLEVKVFFKQRHVLKHIFGYILFYNSDAIFWQKKECHIIPGGGVSESCHVLFEWKPNIPGSLRLFVGPPIILSNITSKWLKNTLSVH